MPCRQASISSTVLSFLLDGSANVDQPLGGIRAAIEQHVFDEFQEILRNLFVDGQLSRIHDAHVQPGLDRVIQKRRVHRLAHGIVAAERKRNVADAAADFAQRQVCLDPPRRFDEINGVIVVFFDPRGDRQNVRIENDVLRREPDLSVRMR